MEGPPLLSSPCIPPRQELKFPTLSSAKCGPHVFLADTPSPSNLETRQAANLGPGLQQEVIQVDHNEVFPKIYSFNAPI